MNIAKNFVDALTEKKKAAAYDTSAKVVRIEGQTAWVHIPGGIDETPVKMTMNAAVGETVQVRVSGGTAFLIGNASSPPTDDRTAIQAQVSANAAYKTAEQASETADQAADTARSAQASADSAAEAAAEAWEKAGEAETAAAEAWEKARDAETAAGNAQDSATTANTAANNALQGLSTMESVVDVVNWFAKHKTKSTDTAVQSGKTYYIYDDITGTLTKVDPEGTENPSEEGWFEMDEAITEYVATHVATTADGLNVIGLANGWRVLISSGAGNYAAGVYLIDPSGNIAQATTGTGITFNSDKAFYIGDENAYIVFDGQGGIRIGGSGVMMGVSKSLDDMLDELNQSISAVEYGKGNSPLNHDDITSWSSTSPEWEEGKYIWQRTTTNGMTYTYTCIQGAKGEQGEDATVLRIDSSRGTVFKNNQISTVLHVTVYSGADTITNQTALRNKFGDTARLMWYWLKIDESDYGRILDNDPKLSDNGFTLTLTPADVDTKVTFKCELSTE